MSATNRNASESRSAFAAGYLVHPIQLRAAHATASQWRDALVMSVCSDGSIDLVDAFTGTASSVWNHKDNTGSLAVGEPVSWHPLYGVLGAGELVLSVVELQV